MLSMSEALGLVSSTTGKKEGEGRRERGREKKERKTIDDKGDYYRDLMLDTSWDWIDLTKHAQ